MSSIISAEETPSENNPNSIPDFASYSDVKIKKSAFFEFLYPFIKIQNNLILDDRNYLLDIKNNTQTENLKLSKKEQHKVDSIAEYYRLPHPISDKKMLDDLLKRVDQLPYELVLVQAANESGWGTSRFAQQGANFFGQWCLIEGCGIVPLSRSKGSSHEVAVFNSAQESIASYFRNLNTHRPYSNLREIRAKLRQSDRPPLANEMVHGLKSYSSRGQAYVDELNHNASYFEALTSN